MCTNTTLTLHNILSFMVVKIHTVVTCVTTLQSGNLASMFKKNMFPSSGMKTTTWCHDPEDHTAVSFRNVGTHYCVTLHTSVHKSEDHNKNIHKKWTTRT